MYDIVVIGVGQAGLSIAYYLKQSGYHFIIVGAEERIGDAWRKRYESLVLFTPKVYSALPGMAMEGDVEALPTKDEVANYLEKYAMHFSFPVQLETTVQKVVKVNDIFEVVTNKGVLCANNVVIATGAFQKPFIPAISSNLYEEVYQLHSATYQSPDQVNKGSVLVVGGGNSGAQIAVELADTHDVTIATSHPSTFLPTKLLGRSIFVWLDRIGLLYAGIDTRRGRWFRKRKDPIFGFELKKLLKEGKVKGKPKVIQAEGKEVIFDDGSRMFAETIIWSTGFIPHYEWIQVEGALDESGFPFHIRGISPVEGLYYIGLPWQYQRGSALICGVGKDAKYIVDAIK
ncbi:flavin-containing monooxygenase [Priestia taiwanensis]|uniref:Oxidoreductase n=1 Tax=Priestia taiwanensis TaxID=1347902 RepID=A0A917AT38_9BACI|nr:NAD(P)/FAD-dependent oxidoreductase [Priestia taiwanensis]MBM7364304.1 putative flavoprotein involved in K+ transport [Priestia taiwanensis]GGE73381.1 oxidoreductase [Priestia taiwanensis]